MISPNHVRLMADYNRWQNRSIYTASSSLSDAQRKEQRGAFFGSIHGTLNHLLWGDQIWMSRFAGTAQPSAAGIPQSKDGYENWDDLQRERETFDAVIVDWAAQMDADALTGDLTWYSGATGRQVTKPRWLLVTHMFNHQTHHRGQVHCMLTQAGAKPDDTDITLLPKA